MTQYPRIKVLQPQPYDLVDQRVQVAGVGSGFEATIGLRVRDGNSRQIARTFVNAGGTGALGNFQAQAQVELDAVPPTADGSGDTLSGIAQEAYGDASQYLRIFAANRNQLSDPNLIFPGRPLRVPMGNRI
jgi:hypothetical protein